MIASLISNLVFQVASAILALNPFQPVKHAVDEKLSIPRRSLPENHADIAAVFFVKADIHIIFRQVRETVYRVDHDCRNTCADDILAEMNWHARPPEQGSFLSDEEDEDDPILRALALEEKTLEELIAETGMPVNELSTQLTLLEISGKIERRAGRAYARVRS